MARSPRDIRRRCGTTPRGMDLGFIAVTEKVGNLGEFLTGIRPSHLDMLAMLRKCPLMQQAIRRTQKVHLNRSSYRVGPTTQSSATTREISNCRASAPSTLRISRTARTSGRPFERIDSNAVSWEVPRLQ